MAKLNITQAAKAVKKHRATLQRHIKDGTLTVEKDGTDNPVIDVSELQRVYGKVHIQSDSATGATVPQNATVRQVDAPQSDSEIKLLQFKLEAKDRELEEAQRREQVERERRHEAEAREQEAKAEKARLFDMLEQAQKTIAALPAPNAEPEPAADPPAKRGFMAWLTGKA